MRVAIYVALLVACIAVAPESTRGALASAAAVLFETLPYAAAAAALAPLLGRFASPIVAYAGCGCGRGPGARSIPATIACAAVFGAPIAVVRWIAAIAVSIVRRGDLHEEHHHQPLLSDLARLTPSAMLAGVLAVSAPGLGLAHLSPPLQLVLGAALGFAAAPCALGGVALASALRAQSPLAAAAVLCVAGIIDLRVWWSPKHTHIRDDRATYAMLALACGIVAYEHGAALVHPRMTLPLFACAAFCAYFALRSTTTFASQRFVAALLLVVSLLGSPPPPSIATEATIDSLYPGERIDFTGEYVANGGGADVVRYAITCCRADAHPTAIRLANPVRLTPGRWIRVRGVAVRRGDRLVVDAVNITQVAPPADPFVYV